MAAAYNHCGIGVTCKMTTVRWSFVCLSGLLQSLTQAVLPWKQHEANSSVESFCARFLLRPLIYSPEAPIGIVR